MFLKEIVIKKDKTICYDRKKNKQKITLDFECNFFNNIL